MQALQSGMQSGMTGQLRLGLGSGPGSLFSGRPLQHMAQQHPKLRLYLSRGSREVLLQGLKTQRLDAAVVDIRAMRPSTDFEVSHSFELGTGFLDGRLWGTSQPRRMVTLRSDETSHIVDIARHSDAVVLTIIAAAPDLVRLPIKPELRASARFGLVTLSQRQEAPALRIVRAQLPKWLKEISG